MATTIKIPTPILWSNKCRKWFQFCGYDTYAQELCRVFDVHRSTFLNRVAGGWPLAAALTAESEGGWNVNNAFLLADNPSVKAYCQTTMDRYMAEKQKHVRKTVELGAGAYIGLPTKVQQFADQLPIANKGGTK